MNLVRVREVSRKYTKNGALADHQRMAMLAVGCSCGTCMRWVRADSQLKRRKTLRDGVTPCGRYLRPEIA